MEQIFDYAVRHIKETIPRRILEQALLPSNRGFGFANQFVTLESAIEQVFIRESVLKDVQLIGGQETTVSLEGLPFHREDDGKTVIKVPLARTGGRQILSVDRINFLRSSVASGYPGAWNSVGAVERRINQLVDASGDAINSSTARCELIATNTLLIHMDGHYAGNMSAVVTLESDNQLSHVPVKAYPKFGALVFAKAKAIIYTRLIIGMDEGMIDRGQDLGVFKQIVDGYSDAHEIYQERLQAWRRTETFMSKHKLTKSIRMIIPK